MPAQPEPVPPLAFDPPHGHTAGCFWDVAQCRWRCGPPAPADQPEAPPAPARSGLALAR